MYVRPANKNSVDANPVHTPFSLSSNAINIQALKRGLPWPQHRNCSSDVTSLMMHVVRCNRTAEKTFGCNLYKTYDDRFVHRCILEFLNIDIIYTIFGIYFFHTSRIYNSIKLKDLLWPNHPSVKRVWTLNTSFLKCWSCFQQRVCTSISKLKTSNA